MDNVCNCVVYSQMHVAYTFGTYIRRFKLKHDVNTALNSQDGAMGENRLVCTNQGHAPHPLTKWKKLMQQIPVIQLSLIKLWYTPKFTNSENTASYSYKVY